MRKVFLTVGPQGAGKSTFCEKYVSENPGVSMISRDNILEEMFGTVCLDPYTGGHEAGLYVLWERVSEVLLHKDATLVLDMWNPSAEDRKDITRLLRNCGADCIEAWYFTTPQETCLEWYLKREAPHIRGTKRWEKIERDSIARQSPHVYQAYHSEPVTIEQGFDTIRIINPVTDTV